MKTAALAAAVMLAVLAAAAIGFAVGRTGHSQGSSGCQGSARSYLNSTSQYLDRSASGC